LLYFVEVSLFLLSFSTLGIACSQNKSCLASLQESPLSESPLLDSSLMESSLKIVEAAQEDKDFQSLLTESSKQREAVLESKEFQDVVETLQTEALKTQTHRIQTLQSASSKSTPAEFTLFVSFSLGEKALLNLAQEAKIYGATLVLRGFKDGSYAKTVHALQKIIQKTGQGFVIDPELFSLFSVTAVPTYVLSRPFQPQTLESTTLESQTLEPQTLEPQTLERTQTPIHDRLQGHVSLQYALEMFAKEGDLKEEAHSLLANPQLKGGRSK